MLVAFVESSLELRINKRANNLYGIYFVSHTLMHCLVSEINCFTINSRLDTDHSAYVWIVCSIIRIVVRSELAFSRIDKKNDSVKIKTAYIKSKMTFMWQSGRLMGNSRTLGLRYVFQV